MNIQQKGSNLTDRTLLGLMWSFSGTAVQLLSKFVVLIVLARLLSAEDFGIVNAALIIISFSMIFSELGIGPAIVQNPKLRKVHIQVGFSMSIVFGLIITLIVWGIAEPVSIFFNVDALSLVIEVLSITFFIQSFAIVARGLLERNLEFKKLTKIQVYSYVIGYGLTSIVLALLGSGIWALVFGHLAQSTIQTIAMLWLQPHSKKVTFSFHIFKELMYFGGGFTLARIFNHIALQGDNIVIGKFLGPAALGYYGRAYQLMVMPANLFGQVLDRVLFPAMAKIQNEKHKINTIFLRGSAVISLIVLPFSVFLIVYATELILVLFGEEWLSVVIPFQILAVGMLFRASYKVSESVARATGAVYRRAWRQSMYAASVLAGSYIGHYWGLNGVAIGISSAIFINFILMTHLSISLLKGSWLSFFKVHLPSIFVTIIVLLITIPLNNYFDEIVNLPAFLNLLFSAFVYLIILVILFRYLPRLSLGAEGRWILNTVNKFIKKIKRSGEFNEK